MYSDRCRVAGVVEPDERVGERRQRTQTQEKDGKTFQHVRTSFIRKLFQIRSAAGGVNPRQHLRGYRTYRVLGGLTSTIFPRVPRATVRPATRCSPPAWR